MNIAPVIEHLKRAAASSQLTERRIEVGAEKLDSFTISPGIIIYPLDGSAIKDGARVARTPGTPGGERRRLFGGRIDYAMKIMARTDEELEAIINAVLFYLHANLLHDANENHIALPDGDIRLEWRDPEGLLMGDHTVNLIIPASAALYNDTQRQAITVDIDTELAKEL